MNEIPGKTEGSIDPRWGTGAPLEIDRTSEQIINDNRRQGLLPKPGQTRKPRRVSQRVQEIRKTAAETRLKFASPNPLERKTR